MLGPTIRAGEPAAIIPSGTLARTTEFAATVTLEPRVTPRVIVDFAASQVFVPMMTGLDTEVVYQLSTPAES